MTYRQAAFFDDPPAPPKRVRKPKPKPVKVTGTVADEKRRFSQQATRLLERLQLGPATNAELSQIALRFSARFHELRKAGHQIILIARDTKTGVNTYSLKD